MQNGVGVIASGMPIQWQLLLMSLAAMYSQARGWPCIASGPEFLRGAQTLKPISSGSVQALSEHVGAGRVLSSSIKAQIQFTMA